VRNSDGITSGLAVAPTVLLAALKRTLLAGALIGGVFGGVETFLHLGAVESAVKSHDEWATVLFPITEGMAWISTPLMLGAAARKLGLRKIGLKELPACMRELERERAFRLSMNVNMLGAAGTTVGLIVGGLSLPASTQPLAYGVAAGSLALSSIPIKLAYLIDRHRRGGERVAA